jgi:hypothetical protein
VPTAVEETGVERWHRERRRGDPTAGTLEVFGLKDGTRGGLLFIISKILEVILKLESLLIVLELISSGSSLKLLLMS